MHTDAYGPQTLSFLAAVAVVVAVLVLRNSRSRPLRIERLWIRPILFLAILVTTVAAAPPPLTPGSIALIAAALVAGCALGWVRGRFMRIEVDPATHDLTSRASPLGLVFILALVLVRVGMRGALATSSFHGLPATEATDALIALAAGMMATQGLEMWLRSRRLLAEAVGKPAVGRNSTTPIVR